MVFFGKNIELWGEDIPWLSGFREKGLRAFEKQGWPTSKTEAWKYSFLNPDIFSSLEIDTIPHECDDNCHCHNHEKSDSYEIKFCDGKLTSEHFDFADGIVIKPLVEALFDGDVKPYLSKNFEVEKFPFAALNNALLEQGIFLCIERGTILDKPIYLHYHSHGKRNLFCNIRNVIVLENGAQATILEDYDGEDGEYFNNVVNEIFVGREAHLHHYKKQNEAEKARHITLNAVSIKQEGSYTAFCRHKECTFARTESFIRLLEKGAQVIVNGVYKLEKNGISDITTNIRHLAEYTTSNQLVKGVLDGNSKGVFQGQIHIAKNSQKTSGNQLHRALLLSNTSTVDCKPELEIFADDVKCSHGATSGDLDKEQLFYMQSRGIELEKAKSILIEAYLNEVYSHIANEEILNWLKK
jgi:Fe-S cluster assembly protein SufD